MAPSNNRPLSDVVETILFNTDGDEVGTPDMPMITEDHSDVIADGRVTGAKVLSIDGFRAGVVITDGLVDISELPTGIVPGPSGAIAMVAASASIQDTAGTEVSGGIATGGSATTLIDSAATFISDGVAIGDKVFNTTTNRGEIVTSVDSEIQVTIERLEGLPISAGDTYSIRTGFGTGAHTVELHSLTADYIEQNFVTFLDGTTPVAIAGTHHKINNFHCMEVNTATVPAVADGDITLENVGRTVTYDVIKAGGNQDLQAFFTVPAGKVCVLEGWTPSLATTKKDTVARILLRSTTDWEDRTLIHGLFQFERVMVGAETGQYAEIKPHLKFPAKSSIKVSAQVVLGTGELLAGANFRIIVKDE